LMYPKVIEYSVQAFQAVRHVRNINSRDAQHCESPTRGTGRISRS
jgi:hypothetical protein